MLAVGLIGLLSATAGWLVGDVMPEPYATIAQYGLAGILGVLLLRRYDSELARERERADKAEDQRDTMTSKLVGDTMPLISEVQRTMVPTMDKLASIVEHLPERLVDQLADRVIDRLERRRAGR